LDSASHLSGLYRHVSAEQVALIEEQINDRRIKEASLKKFAARAKYLKKLLKVSRACLHVTDKS